MQPGLLFYFLLCILSLSAALPASPVIDVDPVSGNVTVQDPDTGTVIPQFPATDGGAGILNGVIWIVFSALVALPFGIAGVRLGRLTVGAAIGVSASFCGV